MGINAKHGTQSPESNETDPNLADPNAKCDAGRIGAHFLRTGPVVS